MKTLTSILFAITLCGGQAAELNSTSAIAEPASTVSKSDAYSAMGNHLVAKVLKVYTAESPSGAQYRAYVIPWQGGEVVVQDLALASAESSEKQPEVGDKIDVMVNEIEMNVAGEKMHVIQFLVLGLHEE